MQETLCGLAWRTGLAAEDQQRGKQPWGTVEGSEEDTVGRGEPAGSP